MYVWAGFGTAYLSGVAAICAAIANKPLAYFEQPECPTAATTFTDRSISPVSRSKPFDGDYLIRAAIELDCDFGSCCPYRLDAGEKKVLIAVYICSEPILGKLPASSKRPDIEIDQ